jgi:hypothetical protein
LASEAESEAEAEAKSKSIFIDEGEEAIEVEDGVADEVKVPLVAPVSSFEGVFALPSSIL